MRALLAATLLLSPLLVAPQASALDLCQRFLFGEERDPVRFAWCLGRFDIAPPPDPPQADDPPQAFVDWAKLMLLWAVCATHDPPTVEINDQCGDSEGEHSLTLP